MPEGVRWLRLTGAGVLLGALGKRGKWGGAVALLMVGYFAVEALALPRRESLRDEAHPSRTMRDLPPIHRNDPGRLLPPVLQ